MNADEGILVLQKVDLKNKQLLPEYSGKLIGIEIAYNRREKTKTRVCYASKGFSDKRAGKETEERIKRE
ncbi:MAG TPA: hypothetical protein VK203_03150 [Nostocaceae cyanobacterium]|nr:hypothetical protein [Nostocaceae cyanobacterium]